MTNNEHELLHALNDLRSLITTMLAYMQVSDDNLMNRRIDHLKKDFRDQFLEITKRIDKTQIS